ncbi:uncharacterized protein LOC129600805 [Paramacrobiotus metropolitanus]|uniref:uncharacterized protein LOC129600805 n=1 Tax=Paramacrobiotus metropolitanus TaxID=2943436 RepID=UPI00244634AE|nr:uncharacterized protein LOC129600805 [Paramacrobiotus metropolitanus]
MPVSVTRRFVGWIIVLCCILLPPGIAALKCRDCSWVTDTEDCRILNPNEMITCEPDAKYCIEWAYFTDDSSAGRPGLLYYGITRGCSEAYDHPVYDRVYKAIASYDDPGLNTICLLEKLNAPLDGTYANRVCICREDGCNSHTWNNLVVQPFLEKNFTDHSIPIFPKLGYNKLPKERGGTNDAPVYKYPMDPSRLTRSGNITSSAIATSVEPLGLVVQRVWCLSCLVIFSVCY